MKIVYGRGGKPDRFYVGGKEVTAAEFRKRCKPRGGRVKAGDRLLVSNLSCWPLIDESLAVHPKQVEQANERNRRRGIGTRYDAKGFAHIPDAADNRRLIKLENEITGQQFVDKRSFY